MSKLPNQAESQTPVERVEKTTNTDKDRNFKHGFYGAIFTVFWVVLASTVFALLIGYNGGQISIENQKVAQQLIWPFVVICLGVPVIILIWFGGISAIAQLRSIKKHLESLDQYVDTFDSMATKASEARAQLQESHDIATKLQVSASEASNTITRNISEFEDDLKTWFEDRLSDSNATNNTTPTIIEEHNATIPQRFKRIYTPAINRFYEILYARNERPGRGRRQLYLTQGGWNKLELLHQIREEFEVDDKDYKDEEFNFLREVFEMEQSSRFQKRTNISEEKLSRLEAETPYKQEKPS